MYNTLFLSTIDKLHVHVDNVCKHSCSPFVDKKKKPLYLQRYTCIAIGWGISTVCDGISIDTPPECLKDNVFPSGWIISVSFMGILTM